MLSKRIKIRHDAKGPYVLRKRRKIRIKAPSKLTERELIKFIVATLASKYRRRVKNVKAVKSKTEKIDLSEKPTGKMSSTDVIPTVMPTVKPTTLYDNDKLDRLKEDIKELKDDKKKKKDDDDDKKDN